MCIRDRFECKQPGRYFKYNHLCLINTVTVHNTLSNYRNLHTIIHNFILSLIIPLFSNTFWITNSWLIGHFWNTATYRRQGCEIVPQQCTEHMEKCRKVKSCVIAVTQVAYLISIWNIYVWWRKLLCNKCRFSTLGLVTG